MSAVPDINIIVGMDAAFEVAYREHYWALTRYVARRTNGEEEAIRDIVADVFTTAWRRRAGLPQPALPWLYATARRTLANHHRSSQRHRNLLQRLYEHHRSDEDDRTLPPEAHAAAESLERTTSALRRLSDADQEVLRLAAWEQLSTEDLATALGCSRSAAAMRLSRARTRLRDQLDQASAPSAPPNPRATTSASPSLSTYPMKAGRR